MANKKLSDGVGKKIVEALKKQSEIEIKPTSEKESQENEELLDALAFESEEPQEVFHEDDFSNNISMEDSLEDLVDNQHDVFINEEPSIDIQEAVRATEQPFANFQQQMHPANESFIKELDTFEIPSNIAVLKKLISQLPSGVTRHTGAQIIKQTMEALGISMKSVLQEAQQVQDGLNNSAKECHATIQEYKKQILMLEKQAQDYQRQYAALNELISLFIQTGV